MTLLGNAYVDTTSPAQHPSAPEAETGTYIAIQFVVSLLNPSTPSQPTSVHGSLGGNEFWVAL